MKNKIISLSLVVTLSLSTLNASFVSDSFDSTTTSGGSWTDTNTGMTYKSYGKKKFSFKKRTTQFTPWFKGRPPGIKAGCGGISLDGGFTAFLNLEEIGKQLETAIASVGMGVIVVLVQTLPSIGKAFEDIQKLVRKIQSMLQNACQLTVAALSKNDTLASAKKGMQKDVDDFLGNNALSQKMQGAATWLDDAMKAANCPDGDTNCYAKLQSEFFQSMGKDDSKSSIYVSKCLVGDKKACAKVDAATGEESKVLFGTLKDLIVDGKIGDKTVAIEDIDKSMMKLKYAIFGLLVVDESNGYTSIIDDSGLIKKEIAVQFMATDDTSPPVSLELDWLRPKNKISNVLEFLTGGKDLNDITVKKMFIPGNVRYVSAKFCPKAKKDGGCESKLVSMQYLEEIKDSTIADIELSWEGLYINTYKTIMNRLNPNNVAPSTPIGVFVPQGEKYIKLIKQSSKGKNSIAAQYYADVLARTNVIFAVKNLILEIKQDAMQLKPVGVNEAIIKQYLNNANEIVKDLQKQLIEYPGDVVYLDHLQNLFEGLRRHNKLTNIGKSR